MAKKRRRQDGSNRAHVRCMSPVAKMDVRRGEPEKAKDLVDPLLSRRRLHRSEFGALCAAEIEVHLAERDPAAARLWLNLWQRVDPDYPEVTRWQQRLGGLPWFRLPGLQRRNSR